MAAGTPSSTPRPSGRSRDKAAHAPGQPGGRVPAGLRADRGGARRACRHAAARLAGGPGRLPQGHAAAVGRGRRDRARPARVRRIGQAGGRPGPPVHRGRAGPEPDRADRGARAAPARAGRVRHRQPDRPGPGPGPARPGPRAGHRAAAARDRRPDPAAAGPARVLVPGVPPARGVHRADRRPAGRGPRLPAALLVTLVRSGLRAGRRRSRSPGVRLRPARRVRRLDRLVPGGSRLGGGRRGRAGSRGEDHGAGHRAVAGT